MGRDNWQKTSIDSQNHEIESLNKNIKEMESKHEEQMRLKQPVWNPLEESNNSLASKDEEINEVHRKLNAQDDKVSDLESSIGEKDDEIKGLSKNQETLRNDYEKKK